MVLTHVKDHADPRGQGCQLERAYKAIRRLGPRVKLAPIEGACALCGHATRYRWTDTVGVAACVVCGAPHRLFSLEGTRRVYHEPRLLIAPSWQPLLRRYFQETGRNCDPGGFNFSGGSSEVAQKADFDSYNAWLEAHCDEWPADAEVREPS